MKSEKEIFLAVEGESGRYYGDHRESRGGMTMKKVEFMAEVTCVTTDGKTARHFVHNSRGKIRYKTQCEALKAAEISADIVFRKFENQGLVHLCESIIILIFDSHLNRVTNCTHVWC